MSVVNGTNGLGAEGSLEMSNGMDGMDSVAAHVDDEVGTGTAVCLSVCLSVCGFTWCGGE